MSLFYRMLIWCLISIQGLMLLFDLQQRNKYNITVSYFYQYEDQLFQMIAQDIRYVIALFLLLPLIVGDFLIFKFLAIVSYCLQIVITQNIYIQKDGNLQSVQLQDWLSLFIKIMILFCAFQTLIMSVLDQEPVKVVKSKNRISQGTNNNDRSNKGTNNNDRSNKGTKNNDRSNKGTKNNDRSNKGTKNNDKSNKGTKNNDKSNKPQEQLIKNAIIINENNDKKVRYYD